MDAALRSAASSAKTRQATCLECFEMSVLTGLEVVQIGGGLAAAVCGRLFADIGAHVVCIDPYLTPPLERHLNHGKAVVSGDPAAARAATATADLIVCEGRPRELHARQHDRARFADSTRPPQSSRFHLSGRPARTPTT